MGFPDSRTCLLNQKLQMLNVCMERRRIRDGGLPFAEAGKPSQAESEEDDEFFDCSSDEVRQTASADGVAPWNRPEGRLSRLRDLTLVDSDEPLFVPVTQEPVPKTEDQLEMDAEVMLQLGSDNELRLQMMSASLLSDMSSFKAANVNGKLEDFIRWYSPRDWIESDTDPRAGQLSSRMLIPGNTWQQVWETARAVPARRQRRLFDDTKEAEKILHYFEAQSIGQIVRLTTATLMHNALNALRANDNESPGATKRLRSFDEMYEKVAGICCKLSREPWTDQAANGRPNSAKRWKHLLSEITHIELMVAKSNSLMEHFGLTDPLDAENEQILSELLLGHDVELPDAARGAISQRLLAMFAEVQRSHDFGEESTTQGDATTTQPTANTLPSPVEKQFTLRLSGRTVSKGMGGPQFLRAILAPNEVRLCGAFSQDITFF